jgi:hypothetical protein
MEPGAASQGRGPRAASRVGPSRDCSRPATAPTTPLPWGRAGVGLAIGPGINVAVESAGVMLASDDLRSVASVITVSAASYGGPFRRTGSPHVAAATIPPNHGRELPSISRR